MKLRQVPASTLTAICTLLRPYAPDVSETLLFEPVRVYEGAAPPEVRPLLSKYEAARLLCVSWWTALRMGRAGKLPMSRVGGQWRFPAEAVRALATGEAKSAVAVEA